MIRNISVLIISLLFSSLSLSSDKSEYTESVFKSDSYELKIKVHCSEGNVSCDNVTMSSRNLKDNHTIELKGKTLNTNCPDVCNFKGYVFERDGYTYTLIPENNGYYAITFQGAVLVNDTGIVRVAL